MKSLQLSAAMFAVVCLTGFDANAHHLSQGFCGTKSPATRGAYGRHAGPCSDGRCGIDDCSTGRCGAGGCSDGRCGLRGPGRGIRGDRFGTEDHGYGIDGRFGGPMLPRFDDRFDRGFDRGRLDRPSDFDVGANRNRLNVRPTAQRQPVTIRWSKDLPAAAEHANRTGKPMLVKIGAEWCGYCRRMSRETFVDRRIVRHVNDCFVPVTLDADRNSDLVERIGAEALPTTVIITSDMRIAQRITGFRSANQLGNELTRYCRADGRHPNVPGMRRGHRERRTIPVAGGNGRFSLLPLDMRREQADLKELL